MFYVGIDIAKVNHQACTIDNTGNVIEESFTFSYTQSGGEKLVSKLVKNNILKTLYLLGWKLQATTGYKYIHF